MNIIGYKQLKIIHEQRVRDLQGLGGHLVVKAKPRRQQRRWLRLFQR